MTDKYMFSTYSILNMAELICMSSFTLHKTERPSIELY